MQYQQTVLRQISPAALAVLGSMDMAYIRKVEEDGTELYAIFSADGHRLGEEESIEVAQIVSRQNDLEAFLVN
ncbi:hypothetical protein [Sneathiella chinensis]|uniref:DUF1150 domain-containing protein n=1 Tax=Sneathiella chinensis TaxID=349750 RepID=A0ABQ5U0P1_9PROT|nr:hypothetical protein [Sneathiella chinensis]GLQ04986.1 hypothetical protein GCM10007924_02070 [Sneathiella chinensis]